MGTHVTLDSRHIDVESEDYTKWRKGRSESEKYSAPRRPLNHMGPPQSYMGPNTGYFRQTKIDPLCEDCGTTDCGACCMATYCPCVAVGEIAESIGMDDCRACCCYASLCFFAGPACADCVHGCSLAQTFRQQTGYNTHENTCTTCCYHWVTDGKSCLTLPLAGVFLPFSVLYAPLACFLLRSNARAQTRSQDQGTTVDCRYYGR